LVLLENIGHKMILIRSSASCRRLASFIIGLWLPCLALSPTTAAWAQGTSAQTTNQPVMVNADTIQHSKRQGTTRAQGGVSIQYLGRSIIGEEAELDHATGQGYMAGEVRMEEQEAVVSASRIDFDLKDGGGKLFNARGRLGASFYFTGARIAKEGPDHYEIEEGSCSTCPFPDQAWRLDASKVSFTVEEYAFITGMKLMISDYPVFYLPYFIIPAKTKRATGFLVPAPGYSQRNGFNIKNQFFWAIADNIDATFGHNHRGSDGDGGDFEFRYIFSERTRGQLNAEYFHQNAVDQEQALELWKILFAHNQLLPLGVENVVQVDMESKESIARRWADDLNARSRRYSDSFFLLRRNWDAASLTAIARTKRSVVPGVEQNIDELPSISFINQKQSILGLPIYWFLESGYSAFRTQEQVGEGDAAALVNYDVDRLDIHPGISAILAPAPWISLEPLLRYRSTWYSTGVDSQGAVVEEPFTRDFYSLSMAMTGPRFFRIFEAGEQTKIKHIVTPAITWSYLPGEDFDGADRARVKPLDQVDLSAAVNGLTFTLTNQGLFKEAGGEDGLAHVTERVKFDISQSYDFNEATREETAEAPLRPLANTLYSLRTRPTDSVMLNLLGAYNIYDNRWETTQVEIGFKMEGAFHFALDRVTTHPDIVWDTAYLELSLPGGATIDISGVYNEQEGYINDGAARFALNRGCWGFTISLLYKKNTLDASGAQTSASDETKVMFAINILGVGDSIGEVAKPLAGRKL